MKKTLAGLSLMVTAVMVMAGQALAQVTPPPPPDPVAVAEEAISGFGGKIIDVFTGLVTNVWVLALFGLGIAIAFASRVVSKGSNKAKKPLGN